jgi:hypothetical protein
MRTPPLWREKLNAEMYSSARGVGASPEIPQIHWAKTESCAAFLLSWWFCR